MSNDDENDYGGGREGGDASYDSDSSHSSSGESYERRRGCLDWLKGTAMLVGFGAILILAIKCSSANGQDILNSRAKPLIEHTREIPYFDRHINYDSQSPTHSQQQRDYSFRR